MNAETNTTHESGTRFMTWLLVGYMWLYVHRPFEVWPWLSELRIERVFMIITLVYAVVGNSPKWTSNRVNLGVGLLAVAIILSAAVSPYMTAKAENTVQDWFKVLVFYLLLMTCVHSAVDLRKVIVGFVVVMAIYELHSLREYFCGRGMYRMGTWRMVGVDATMYDPNSFASTVNYGLPMLLPILTLAKKRWHYIALVAAAALAITCILLTGSRTGFVVLLVQASLVVLLSKRRVLFISACVVIVPLVWLSLPQDRQDRYMTMIDPSRGPANAEDSMRGRLQGFWDGISNWNRSPVLGVGPGCHGYAVGNGMQAHNLYGQVLGEVGTVGAVGLLLLVLGLVLNFMEARRLAHPPLDLDSLFLYRVILATIWSTCLLLIGGWGGHNLFRYNWLWFAAFSALSVRFLAERQANVRTEQEALFALTDCRTLS